MCVSWISNFCALEHSFGHSVSVSVSTDFVFVAAVPASSLLGSCPKFSLLPFLPTYQCRFMNVLRDQEGRCCRPISRCSQGSVFALGLQSCAPALHFSAARSLSPSAWCCSSSCVGYFDLIPFILSSSVCESLQGEAGIILELPDQKA
jgi:hypothetical protein